MNIYETGKLLSEYLLFHYGTPEEILPEGVNAVAEALNYPERCVSQCVDFPRLAQPGRALDLGCAVGRSTFELARHCTEVIGIDYSHAFIAAAQRLQAGEAVPYVRTDEGRLGKNLLALAPERIDLTRVTFQQGDAMRLPEELGSFDLVLMANLIDRLSDPSACLSQLSRLLRPAGQLIITSPYTWLEEFTPRERWLGGVEIDGAPVRTLDGLRAALGDSFELVSTSELPFLIREHARKFQWSIAQASLWRRL